MEIRYKVNKRALDQTIDKAQDLQQQLAEEYQKQAQETISKYAQSVTDRNARKQYIRYSKSSKIEPVGDSTRVTFTHELTAEEYGRVTQGTDPATKESVLVIEQPVPLLRSAFYRLTGQRAKDIIRKVFK